MLAILGYFGLGNRCPQNVSSAEHKPCETIEQVEKNVEIKVVFLAVFKADF